MADTGGVSGQRPNITTEAMKEVQEAKLDRAAAQQDLKEDRALEFYSRGGLRMFAGKQRKKKTKGTLQDRVRSGQKTKEKLLKGELSKEQQKEQAAKFQKRNPELRERSLMSLRGMLKEGEGEDSILRKVEQFYEDVSLADEALEFLEETTPEPLRDEVAKAREKLHEKSAVDITKGRNIGAEARAFSAKGLGSPSALRELYRDITANPRDANQLFQELSGKFPYKQLKKVFKFMFRSLGSDLKSKGSSIEKGLLHNLMKETRVMQAILGVYHFFNKREKLMNKLFENYEIERPAKSDFEAVAKNFMSLLGDRYPSVDKLLRLVSKLTVGDELLAKLIFISQMRDAVREVSLYELYRSVQHRDEVYATIIDALEELEEEHEEEEEEHEEERDEEEGKE